MKWPPGFTIRMQFSIATGKLKMCSRDPPSITTVQEL